MIQSKGKFLLLSLMLMLVTVVVSVAADLTYSTVKPQTTDSELVMLHKAQVNISKMVAGNLASNITTAGTTSVVSTVLDRLVVNTAGSADSAVVLKSGSTVLATASTAAQASLPYNLAIASGTLTVITSGSTAPNLTLSYR